MDRSKSENSLCENSMKVVTNMIKMSSFSLSQKTLGTCRSAAKDLSGPDKVPEMVPRQLHESRLQKPQSRSNPIIVIDPIGNDRPNSHPIHNESSVDGLASEYITKIRRQLECGL